MEKSKDSPSFASSPILSISPPTPSIDSPSSVSYPVIPTFLTPSPPMSPSSSPPASPAASPSSSPKRHHHFLGGSFSLSGSKGSSLGGSKGSGNNHFQQLTKPKSSAKHYIYNENSDKPTKAFVEPPHQNIVDHHNHPKDGNYLPSLHLDHMFKGIKDGLSHARKDKIKIEYELEFRKLLNLPDDLIGQCLMLKWSRGKKKKGETKEYKVLRPTIPTIPSITITPKESTLLSNTPAVSTSSSSSSSTAKLANLHALSGSSSLTSSGKSKESFTKKQAKLLIGNKIDGSNSLCSGDGYISMKEKVNLKITLYTEPQVKENTISTNFEQKLITLTLLWKNTTLCSTTIDLSLHSEDNGALPIDVPFPSSSSVQPSIQLAIKTNYLKYNDKKIIKASPENIKSKELAINPPNGANKLMEIQGDVYLVSSASDSSSKGGHGTASNRNSISGNASDSDPHSETITRSTSWDDESDDTFQLSTKDALAKKTIEINQMNEKLSKYEAQISEMECKIEQKNTDILALRHVIDENQSQALIFEESVHRAKVLEERATRQLIHERAEFAQFRNSIATGKPTQPVEQPPLDIRDFEKELEMANLQNETLKQKMEEMEAQYRYEKKQLEENVTTITLLYEDTKEKLKCLRANLDNEMKSNNSKLIQESELRKRITQQLEIEKNVKFSKMSTQKKIFYNPYIAWAVALICFIMYISSGC